MLRYPNAFPQAIFLPANAFLSHGLPFSMLSHINNLPQQMLSSSNVLISLSSQPDSLTC